MDIKATIAEAVFHQDSNYGGAFAAQPPMFATAFVWGVYELSAAAYRSRWFCVLKQDGKTLRLVHDLQPLNAVTIRDSSVPPFVEHLAKSFGGYAVYGMMDLFAGYDQQPLL